MQHLEPELILKTTPPKSPRLAVARERLSIDRPELVERLAITVHAPAGFGKTFQLGQWRREWLARGAVVGWLSLDERDDELRFVQGLAAAMAVGSGRQSFAALIAHQPARSALQGLTNWLAEVADLGGEVVLILDEADSLPEATVRLGLTYLLHNIPANLRVVISTRRRLNLKCSELVARGQYLVLDAEALRLRQEETLAILSARFAGRIDTERALRLHERVEGWPLGLQLAIASLEKSASPERAIEALAAGSEDIERYFVDNLLSRLSGEQLDFLTRIAALDMLHPELCAAVTENPRAPQLLQTLCEDTPILHESDHGAWVRLHPLARDFLLRRLASYPPEVREDGHRRAAGWLEAHDLFEEAARHYLKAGAASQAYQTIERCLYDVMLLGQYGRVLEWLETLPAAVVRSRPQMCLAGAWALAMSERHQDAADLLACLGEVAQQDESIRCEVAAIHSAAAYFADQPDLTLSIIAPWLEDYAPKAPIKVQAILANQAARLALFQGQAERARRICQRAPHYAWTSGMDAICGFSEWLVGASYLHEGRMQPAEAALRASLQRAEQDIGPRSPVAVMLASTLAAVLLESGQPQQAALLLANRLDVLEHLSSPDVILLGYLTSARVAMEQGQNHRCYDLLEALLALGEERGIPRFCIAALAEQIRLHARLGRADTCQALWRRLEQHLAEDWLEQDGLLGPELALLAGVGRCSLRVAQQDWQRLLQELPVLEGIAERLRQGRRVVQLKLFRALALRGLGEEAEAVLHEAISLADEYGLHRVLREVHPQLDKWIEQVRAGQSSPASAAVAAPVPASPRGETAAQVSASRLLTPKEREVLQLLARNLSNKQIALALEVGEETVKWHLKNLFGKFQAGTRKHVVDRAYMLGILESHP